MRGLVKHILLLINLCVALPLLGGCLAPYIQPTVSVLPSYLAMVLPVFFILNLAFLIFWLLRFKAELLLSLFALGLSMKPMALIFQFNETGPAKVEEKADFRIMTYNVRIFDRYLWSNNKKTADNLLTYLKADMPDILCMQEFGFNNNDINTTEDRILNAFSGYKYRYIAYTVCTNDIKRQGIAIFSKFPIVERGVIRFNGSHNFTIWADIVIKEQKFRLFSCHLQSIMLEKKGVDFVSRIEKEDNNERLKAEVDKISMKMGAAFKERSRQAEIIAEAKKASPYPIIICGDFNDTPSSYSYAKVKGDLKDLFVQKGFWLGRTYNGEYPAFRIDYIFYDEYLQPVGYDRPKLPYSDHFPVVGEFRIVTPE